MRPSLYAHRALLALARKFIVLDPHDSPASVGALAGAPWRLALVAALGLAMSSTAIGLAVLHVVARDLRSLAHAARSVHAKDTDFGPGVVTVEMKTSFMQPAKGPLVAKGRLIHRTATLAFTEGSVYDAAGRICSHATGTFKYVKRLPVDGRNINQLKSVSTD